MTKPNWIEEFLEYNKDVADVGSLIIGMTIQSIFNILYTLIFTSKVEES